MKRLRRIAAETSLCARFDSATVHMVMGGRYERNIAIVYVLMLIGTIVLSELLALPTAEMQATTAAAEQWCHSMNGTLEVSRVIGETGGLHCRAPNGELVEYQ